MRHNIADGYLTKNVAYLKKNKLIFSYNLGFLKLFLILLTFYYYYFPRLEKHIDLSRKAI